MALTCALDLPTAREQWASGVALAPEQRQRAEQQQDPVWFLALEAALQRLCLELLSMDVRSGELSALDFWIESIDGKDPATVGLAWSAKAQYVLHRHLLEGVSARWLQGRGEVELLPREMLLPVTTAGRFVGRFLPYRRKVIEQNMRRVYGARITDQRRETLVLAHYSHLATLLRELLMFRFKSIEHRASLVRVEGVETIVQAFEAGRGALILTGHFGNFEVSTVSGIEHFPMAKGRIHFLRRPIKPKWLSDFLTRRFNKAGFGVIGRRGSLDEIVTRLEAGEAIVFPFDQYAHKPDGISVPLFGVAAGTYKSMAVIAMATGAPVIPGASWREADGTHVLRFWPALSPVENDDVGREIALNTEAYNRALEHLILRKPAQWWWVHRRWKNAPEPT